jgi:hypothetical protein
LTNFYKTIYLNPLFEFKRFLALNIFDNYLSASFICEADKPIVGFLKINSPPPEII